MNLVVDNTGQLVMRSSLQLSQPHSVFMCSSRTVFSVPSSILCAYILAPNTTSATVSTDLPEAEINSIAILPEGVYWVARNNCIQANVTGHQCQWVPYSDITKQECVDCQPICRSVHQTLTFAQFMIGNALVLLSSAFQFAPIVSLLMNQSPPQIQV